MEGSEGLAEGYNQPSKADAKNLIGCDERDQNCQFLQPIVEAETKIVNPHNLLWRMSEMHKINLS